MLLRLVLSSPPRRGEITLFSSPCPLVGCSSSFFHSPSTSFLSPSSLPHRHQGTLRHPELSRLRASEGGADEAQALVNEALQRATEAMEEAQRTVQRVDSLPSARLPTRWDPLIKSMKPVVQVFGVLGLCFSMHALGSWWRIIGAASMAVAVGLQGYRKGSLSASGCLAAMIVGFSTLWSSFRSGIVLLSFFFASSLLTRLGEAEKAEIDDGHKTGGQRDWIQVFSNGIVPALVSVIASMLTGSRDFPLWTDAASTIGSSAWTWAVHLGGTNLGATLATGLNAAVLGYFACCCGDTWASELGQLSSEEPRLITTLRPVRKGTNGGVTMTGLTASLAGGLAMGTMFYLAGVISPTGNPFIAMQQWQVIPLGLCAGLAGSLLDSYLGATVQFTGFNRKTGKVTSQSRNDDVTKISGVALLDNNAVNFVSATGTACLTAWASLWVAARMI